LPAAGVAGRARGRRTLRRSTGAHRPTGRFGAAQMQDRGHLMTELRNPRSTHIDRMTIPEAVEVLLAEDATISAAVAAAKAEIARTIELVVAAFEAGGRLIYVGAGTSGRLGVLDASECPPTFGVAPDRVAGIIAGGDQALRSSVEGCEDDRAQAEADINACQAGLKD